MHLKFYIIVSALLCSGTLYSCPLCKDALGNVNKPFFHEDETGRRLDEKTALILSNVHKYIKQNTQEKAQKNKPEHSAEKLRAKS